MATYKVLFKMDMVFFEKSSVQEGVTIVRWSPFDAKTPVAREDGVFGNLKEIEAGLVVFAAKHEETARGRVGEERNGYKATVGLYPQQRKPNGWNTSRRLKIEKEF